ncbi:MAG: hypothetical protein H6631_00850 [Anaerolineaceae bacterium]|nr:hypothetical protein [Anaerolineaceae bacterium]MCB9098148.1 hypothetical protein [Anaerolineales bacterium]
MMNIHVANQSPFRVRFPEANNRADNIDLAKKYLAQEQSLPAKKQNLFTPIIDDLLQQIIDCEKKIAEGEAQRAVAADEMSGLAQRNKELVSSMLKTIAAAYPDRPAKAQEWGFATKKETANIRTPRNQKERLAVMARYITKEESRPEAERFTIPALAEVIDNYETCVAILKTRDAGRYQREAHVNAANMLAKQLSQYLQLAAGVIVGYDYKLDIKKDLQHWGFKVIERRSGGKTESNGAAPADGSTNDSAGSPDVSDMMPDLTN